MSFALHPQLTADTLPVGDLPLCRVLLMNNCRFPWLVLVPRRENLRELFDLGAEDYTVAWSEVRMTAERFASLTSPHKMNVAALGNMVPQLHIHIIARFPNDTTWPAPVWSAVGKPVPYSAEIVTETIEKLGAILNITKM